MSVPHLILASLLLVGLGAAQPDPLERDLSLTRATPAELRWRTIPWMRSLKGALARAQREGKPVFYFGYDGILDTGNS